MDSELGPLQGIGLLKPEETCWMGGSLSVLTDQSETAQGHELSGSEASKSAWSGVTGGSL